MQPISSARLAVLGGSLSTAYFSYYVGVLSLALSKPEFLIVLGLLAQWVATLKLLNNVLTAEFKRFLGVWFVLSPLFLLPSAVTFWKILLFGSSTPLAWIALGVALGLFLALPLLRHGVRVATFMSSVLAVALFVLGALNADNTLLGVSSGFSFVAGVCLSYHLSKAE
jgi:hypothetical protein